MKYLVIGGCSHAVGTGLVEALGHQLEGGVDVRKIYRYSALLAKKLNLEEINLGEDGAPNVNLYMKVIQWIMENKDKVKDTLFIFGWTYPERGAITLRGEFHSDESTYKHLKYKQLIYIPNLPRAKNTIYSPGFETSEEWGFDVEALNYHTYTNMFPYIFGLSSFLSSQNIKYLQFHADAFFNNVSSLLSAGKPVVSKDPTTDLEYIKQYSNYFNTKNYILDTTYRHYCREDIITPPKYSIHEGHIGPEGQRLWADYLYEQLFDRGILV
tara:strand:- start:1943 stop:2749 length:807 start_codon:yes stop_codon:yes gene_type:complete